VAARQGHDAARRRVGGRSGCSRCEAGLGAGRWESCGRTNRRGDVRPIDRVGSRPCRRGLLEGCDGVLPSARQHAQGPRSCHRAEKAAACETRGDPGRSMTAPQVQIQEPVSNLLVTKPLARDGRNPTGRGARITSRGDSRRPCERGSRPSTWPVPAQSDIGLPSYISSISTSRHLDISTARSGLNQPVGAVDLFRHVDIRVWAPETHTLVRRHRSGAAQETLVRQRWPGSDGAVLRGAARSGRQDDPR